MAALTNDIYIGSVDTPLYHFTNADLNLGSPKGSFAVDTIGNELSIDTMQFSVRYGQKVPLYKTSDDQLYKLADDKLYVLYTVPGSQFMSDVPYGTPVWWYVEGAMYAKGFIKSIDRTSKYSFKINCISGIGLLDEITHVGGVYTGQKFGDIIGSIIKKTNTIIAAGQVYMPGKVMSIILSKSVYDLHVYGHLPYDTARNNLHRLLFSCGATTRRILNNTYDYYVNYLVPSTATIPANRVMLGGSINTQLPTNTVEITEYTYSKLPTDLETNLFDNTGGSGYADHQLVVFAEPMHNLTTTGSLTIEESNANYAIVSGIGTLVGKQYTHSENILTLSNASANDPVRLKSVKDNHLVSFINSLNVAKRVLAYYSSAKTVKAKILLDSEVCSNLVTVTDPFGDTITGLLEKMDVAVTTVKSAECQIVQNYTPGDFGNRFTNSVLISASGSWTVPSGVKSIRVVIIGAGSGGVGGYDGEKGAGGIIDSDPDGELTIDIDGSTETIGYANAEQRVPVGGGIGDPGVGGYFAVYDIAVVPTASATVTLGSGGTGGSRNGGVGSDGTATTFTINGTTYSSADGQRNENGFYDPFSDATYALSGEVGHVGGNGGQTDTQSLYATNGEDGLSGESVGTRTGGIGGAGLKKTYQYFDNLASGGGGGGAAYGANGGAGGNARWVDGYQDGEVWINPQIYSGDGGNGANAAKPSKPTYGCGGGGGNGGGAGGNVGGLKIKYNQIPYFSAAWIGTAGAAGQGSQGGDGGDGCVIIYY